MMTMNSDQEKIAVLEQQLLKMTKLNDEIILSTPRESEKINQLC